MTKFITNQNIEINLELASLGDRIIATILDLLILGAYALVMSIVVGASGGSSVVMAIVYIPMLFYSLAFELFKNGQSPGKSARDIKVVKLDGGAPTVGNLLLRWLFRPIDILLYGAVAMLSIILSKSGQRLGDLAGGTTVIKVKRRASLEDIQTMRRDELYDIIFPQVKRLNDKQIQLVRSSLKMGDEGLNYQVINQLALKIKDILQITTELPDVKFLYTIIADYEHLDR